MAVLPNMLNVFMLRGMCGISLGSKPSNHATKRTGCFKCPFGVNKCMNACANNVMHPIHNSCLMYSVTRINPRSVSAEDE